MTPPPGAVLRAFGARGDPVPLAGGAGTSWRAGGVVLKPLDTAPEDVAWQEELLAPLQGRRDLRVAAPLRSPGGDLVVEGWTARPFLVGEPATGRWAEVVEAGRRLHAATAGARRPSHLDARRDPWAVGERVAWEEVPLEHARWAVLADLRRPLDLPSQVVHGDLTGNVLLEPGLPPAVIDLSTCWRPAGWADAVVVADALVWHGGGAALVHDLLPGPVGAQLLVRALLFRAVVDALLSPAGGPTGAWRHAEDVATRAVGAAGG